jgi:hypothetical protein
MFGQDRNDLFLSVSAASHRPWTKLIKAAIQRSRSPDIESGRIVSLLDDYSIGALSLYSGCFGEKMHHRVSLFMDQMVSRYASVDRGEREVN